MPADSVCTGFLESADIYVLRKNYNVLFASHECKAI